LIINKHSYDVDGEVGRFSFQTHSGEKDGKIVYNSARSLFPERKGKEKYKTSGFKEIGMIYGTVKDSYRETAYLINRIRHQEGVTPVRTLKDNTEREGGKVLDFLEQKTRDLFEKKSFTEEGVPQDREEYNGKDIALIAEEEIRKAIDTCGLSEEEVAEINKNPVYYEEPEHTVNVSIDDVIVKKQKEERSAKEKQEPKREGRKYAHDTIAHIQKDGLFYVINGYSVIMVLKIVIGFLLNNDLLRYRLQFFVDGQKTLQAAILKTFFWYGNIGILLDWYHLDGKCKMQLSMALKGRQIRNDVLSQLMPFLWYGMVDKAIEYLSNLSQDLIKNRDELDRLINYIERNRPYIPCYGIRKKLGLRISSNIGEKMNDLVVSDRQKHNGMSWSSSGSAILAALSVLKRNKEYATWFECGDLKFKLAA
jgi:hypothetical protein